MKFPIKTCTALVLATLLGGCGGGGGDAAPAPVPVPTPVPTPDPVPVPAPVITLSAPSRETLAGGRALTLNASASDNGAITWKLAPGSVGSLSGASGASVVYTPPPASAVSANTVVNVIATTGAVSQSLSLTVFPEPGTPGLYRVAGQFYVPGTPPPIAKDGTGEEAVFFQPGTLSADLAGNLYLITYPSLRPGAMFVNSIKRITPARVVTTLEKWFGVSWPSGTSAPYVSRGNSLAADRAGNLYLTDIVLSSGTRNFISKLAPDGTLSALVGPADPQTGILLDGSNPDARLLTPRIVGIDADDNLYLEDRSATDPLQNSMGRLSKVTPAGKITSVTALPAELNADQDGNTYRVDYANHTIIKRTPAGVESVIAGVSGTAGNTLGALPATLNNPSALVKTGPATFALLSNDVVLKLVLPH